MKKEKIKWFNETRKLDELVPTSYNPRKLSEDQYWDLKRSLDEMGLAEIPAINKETNQILAGHMRIKVLIDLYGRDYEIDVRVPERVLTKKECDRYLIVSNKSGGDWNFDMLSSHFDMPDLIDWGFKEEEFGFDTGMPVGQGSGSGQASGDPKIILSFEDGNFAQILEAFTRAKEDMDLDTNELVILKLLEPYL